MLAAAFSSDVGGVVTGLIEILIVLGKKNDSRNDVIAANDMNTAEELLVCTVIVSCNSSISLPMSYIVTHNLCLNKGSHVRRG